VLGFAGLVGAGRSEVAQALFGLDPLASGRVWVHGKPAAIHSPRDAMTHGIGLVPEDRKRQGLVLSMSAKSNTTLATLQALARLGFINHRAEREHARAYFDRLRVRASSPDVLMAGLSGGNQQKVVLAKWLAARCRILILDEPTRGVDVGARQELYQLIRNLAVGGVGVLLVSSEVPEVLGLADRVLVMREGRVIHEAPSGDLDEHTVLDLVMAGSLMEEEAA